MNFRSYIIFFLCLILCLNTSLSAQNKTDSAIVDGVSLFDAGKYNSAMEVFSKILEKDKQNDAAWYYKSKSNLRLRKIDEATSDIKNAIAIDSTNYWYRNLLASIYLSTGEKEQAKAEIESLVKLFPKRDELYFSLLKLYLDENNLDKAIGYLNEYEALIGKTDMTVRLRYNILIAQKKQEEGLAVLKNYCEEYSSPEILTMLGEYEAGISNDSTAVKYFDEALSIYPDYLPAILGKAEAYRLTKKYDRYFPIIYKFMENSNIEPNEKSRYFYLLLSNSNASFQETYSRQLDSTANLLLNNHPDDSTAFKTVILYHTAANHLDKAERLIKDRLTKEPDNKEYTTELIKISYQKYGTDKALEYAQSASIKFPEEADFYEMQIIFNFQKKDYRKAVQSCEDILRLPQLDSARTLMAYNSMGDALIELKEYGKGFKAYDKALKLNPNYAPVLNNYAYFLSTVRHNYNKAEKLGKKAVELEPNNPVYLDTYGWILYLKNKPQEAHVYFKQAMLYGGKEEPEILAHYSIILDKLGNKELSEVYRLMAEEKSKEKSNK